MSACNPGGVKDINIIFQTASKADKAWKEHFGGPVEDAISNASHGAASDTSPIIATIAAVLERPDFDARVERRRLIIASDLLEYQKGVYTQLNGGDFWGAYKASPLPRLMPLDLRGATVAIDYFARPAYAAVQGEAHRNFWRRLLQTAGANEVTFIGMREADKVPPPADRALDALADVVGEPLRADIDSPSKSHSKAKPKRKGQPK